MAAGVLLQQASCSQAKGVRESRQHNSRWTHEQGADLEKMAVWRTVHSWSCMTAILLVTACVRNVSVSIFDPGTNKCKPHPSWIKASVVNELFHPSSPPPTEESDLYPYLLVNIGSGVSMVQVSIKGFRPSQVSADTVSAVVWRT